MSGEVIAPPSTWERGVVRHTGAYALVGDHWRPARTIPTAPGTTTVKLYDADGIAEVPVAEVREMVKVRPSCRYRDLPFELSRVFDPDDALIWHDVPLGAPTYRGQLLIDFSHPDWRRAAAWEGFSEDRVMGFVVGRVALSDITDYDEEISSLSLPSIGEHAR